MKHFFFMGAILAIPLAIAGLLLFHVGKFIWSLFKDQLLYKELDEIQVYSESRRQQREEKRQARLDNGCQHSFTGAIGFPPGVCPKCGITERKPSGLCDHVWRRNEDPTPSSHCEKCGKQFRPNLD